MNPMEREELARLLPSPGDPLLPDDRLSRLEDHLMQEITGEATVRITGGRTSESDESVLSRPSRSPLSYLSSRSRRRFVVVAMPLGVAAAVLATVVVTGLAGRGPTVDEEAAGLLKRIATVTTEGRATPVRDDQYLYIRTQGTARDGVTVVDGEWKTPENPKEYSYRRTDWISVDGKRKGLARTTWLGGRPSLEGLPDELVKKRLESPTEDMTLYADPNNSYYDQLEALPTDPDKLYDKVWAATTGQGPTHEWAAMEYIGTMLDGAQLLPELNGALYRAAARVPGVRVVDNAEDAAGREGIGLVFGEGDDRDVWVFDKKTLKYLGSDSRALLEVAVVDKMEQTPTD
ncbi:CU044_5270 family protein [Streptomyces sp. NPDC002787]